MEYLQNCLYINLENRPDRLEHVKQQLDNMGINGERFNAIRSDDGAVGCTLSHLKCLKIAKERDWDHVFVCEDDITFLDPNTFKTNLDRFMKSDIDWDVCIVGGNNGPPFVRMDDFCIRTFNCQTTTGYIVKKRFYDVLIENFHNSATNLIKEPEQRRLYAIDVYWKRLQAGGTWYMITPVTVIQKEGYSDIEKKNMNYTPLMMDLEKKWLQNRINPVTH
tara:strand:+ start:554 stop:1213 length:660 start_codon:yes stop_codon:yes gene_type:complete